MPTSATSSPPSNTTRSPPHQLLRRLTTTAACSESKLKALRELKNQIIGNPTRKLAYLRLNAVSAVVSILQLCFHNNNDDDVSGHLRGFNYVSGHVRGVFGDVNVVGRGFGDVSGHVRGFVDDVNVVGRGLDDVNNVGGVFDDVRGHVRGFVDDVNDVLDDVKDVGRGFGDDVKDVGGGFGDDVKDVIVIQGAAVIGSFACGLDEGAKAVMEAGAFDLLLKLMPHPNFKVVDAVARALKLIYQSKFAPKFDFLQEKNMEYLILLLNNENENLTGLGASIITHSCQTNAEQKVLSDTGATERLLVLLRGSLAQRDASLESLASIFKDNREVTSKFVGPGNGRMLRDIVDLTKDKCPRTRLLACILLIVIRNADPLYLQEIQVKIKLIEVLFELVHDSGQVGDEAPFALSKLISDNEEVQKLAFDANGVDRLCDCFNKYLSLPRRLEGIFLALADLCSKLECCRSRFLALKGLDFVVEALGHDRAEVRAATCICLRNVTRSIKNLSAHEFMNETLIHLLLPLLCDKSYSVQVAAFGAINNIVVDCMPHKTVALRSGVVKILAGLSKSMDSTIRLNSVRALKNLMFLASCNCKQEILLELTLSTLTSLICDSEASVQEQALSLVRNLVDGSVDSIDYVLAEDCLLLNAVKRQLENRSKDEVLVQAVYVLGNVASGNELHKEAVMQLIFPQKDDKNESVICNLLKSNDSRLRTAVGWLLINLTLPDNPGTCDRVTTLRDVGIVSLLKNMMNDRCMDAKLRAKTAHYQVIEHGD
ncbi:hypothetical protein LIER_07060 [Lithospermum erythrorhizon]|uniref:Armadillo repeat-containing protein 8 n=1 Tax=Lithospermum erythrorhizon TaxID=34254 RepID=A0AAV3PAL5_LITER